MDRAWQRAPSENKPSDRVLRSVRLGFWPVFRVPWTSITSPRRLLGVLGLYLIAASWHAVAAGMATSGSNPLRRVESVTELFGLAHLHIATNHTDVEFGPDSYAIAADTQSNGLADIFVDLKTHSEARGSIVRGQLQPRSYRGEVHHHGNDSYASVEHRDDGSVTAAVNPPSVSLRADPAVLAQTTDQMTAFLSIERQVAMGGLCTRDIPVFDGRHLYTLHFHDAGSQPLTPAHAAGFAGSIRVCRMAREAISGFADAAGRSEGVYEAAIYYASLTGDELAIPLRMDLETEFGPVTAHLVALRVNGLDRHPPE